MNALPALSRAAVDEAVSTERRRLADSVADLTDEQWATPSLCAAWTVRDVIAHLTVTTRLTVPRLLRAAVRARGSFDRMEVALAAQRAAAYTTAELVAQLRESADSTRRFPGSTPVDPLMDLVVHGQDVARPLGRRYVSPPEVVAACLAYVARNRFMGGPRRLSGVRLVSTDTGWTLGDGAELRGPDVDLLLVAAGRRAGLDALAGPGTAVVAERLG
ncbi:maleylpyruvate isomerase family mycothiol-dependent enzyme [Geodermatophilus sp. TF02-6]|uniref:maleylpyruvate isomerase family mycothiol-dependent enzyme n=1 Tax=Geodermatophilus sp. TF02-6 TaxID=2250575 RepID=UPI000DE978F2|nr:maleylpyruvate isomerase family mycothiol-dependent enzyme [Geodermatophilus sp. TF02-6]RBY80967.1 maleylpyruvate isomerase family mycothiol-dependent enzyme [Geodermatophilus sp. TF02-6]